MERVLQKRNHVLRRHAFQHHVLPIIGLMKNLLLESSDQCIREGYLACGFQFLNHIFLAIFATRLFHFHGVGKVVNFANLGRGLRDSGFVPVRDRSNEETNGKGETA